MSDAHQYARKKSRVRVKKEHTSTPEASLRAAPVSLMARPIVSCTALDKPPLAMVIRENGGFNTHNSAAFVDVAVRTI